MLTLKEGLLGLALALAVTVACIGGLRANRARK